jgi:hypothetical protein
VRVDCGVAEVGVDAVDQSFRRRVLHVLGFLVDLVPGHGQGLGEEPLEQAMPADDLHRQPLARVGQTRAFVRRVGGEAGLGKRLEHSCDCAG